MVQSQAIWQKTKSGGKTGFDKLWGWADKLGAPVNRLSNKLGSEAFWPTTLDKECDKAARILRSFCKDGFYQEEEPPTADGPKQKQRVLKKVPAEVIKNAKGLAIFTTMRTGLWVSGAGGSGILVGRQSDGSWSPPSGIMLHTAGLGFLVGVDIYDCVLVINSQDALDAFSKVRCTLGGEVSAVAGPVGIGGVLESEVHKRQAPIFTYLKSRGFYAGVQIDGTIIIERTDENERFYGERIGVADILAGKAKNPPYEIMRLMETIRAAQGDTDINQSLLTDEPPPSDFQVNGQEGETTKFGIPDEEDPDPFGVLALEKQGLLIREAGTNKRPTSEQFEFKPSPTSPIYATFRRSMDRSSIDSRTISRRSSWRTSTMSTLVDRGSQSVDMATQTDFEPPVVQVHPPALPARHEHSSSPKMAEIPEHRSTDDEKEEKEPSPKDKSDVTEQVAENIENEEVNDKAPEERPTEKKDERDQKSEVKDLNAEGDQVPSNRDPKTLNNADSEDDADDIDDADDGDDADDDEVAIVQEVHQAAAPQVITRARLVTVAKPIPPKLPPRNPHRARLTVNSDLANEGSAVMRDQGAGPSPMTATVPMSPSTPSLHHDHSSASSKDSISSVEGIESLSENMEPKINVAVDGHKDSKLEIQPTPDSPVKQLPGSFQ